jgi:Fe2+ transport system protein FeoA
MTRRLCQALFNTEQTEKEIPRRLGVLGFTEGDTINTVHHFPRSQSCIKASSCF